MTSEVAQRETYREQNEMLIKCPCLTSNDNEIFHCLLGPPAQGRAHRQKLHAVQLPNSVLLYSSDYSCMTDNYQICMCLSIYVYIVLVEIAPATSADEEDRTGPLRQQSLMARKSHESQS